MRDSSKGTRAQRGRRDRREVRLAELVPTARFIGCDDIAVSSVQDVAGRCRPGDVFVAATRVGITLSLSNCTGVLVQDVALLAASYMAVTEFQGGGGNVYFGGAGRPVVFPGGRTLAQWAAATGADARSVEADPLLCDPAAGDFAVLPASPAWALGWAAIDQSQIGVIAA